MGLFFSENYSRLNKAMKKAEKAYKEKNWRECYYASVEASHFLDRAFMAGDLCGSVHIEWGEK